MLSLLFCTISFATPVDTEPWLDVDLYRSGFPFVPARVNGVEVAGLLDSGAAMTCVSTGQAKRLGLETGAPIVAEGVGGSVPATLFDGIDLEVGGLALRDIQVVVIDFTEVELQLGRALPLVLGREVFDAAVVDLDYPNRRVAFRDTEVFEYAGAGIALPLFDTTGGLLAVELAIGDAGPARFMIDTGSNGSIAIHPTHARRTGLFEDLAATSTALAGGAGGMHEVRRVILPEVTWAGRVLHDVTVSTAPAPQDGRTPPEEAGSLGAQLFGRSRVLFDTARERLIVEAPPG